MFENLEARRMFSVQAETTGGTLVVVGDSTANWISVELNNGLLRVWDYSNGAHEVYHANADYVWDIVVRGGAGSDWIFIADNITENVTVFGGAGNDYIKGGGGYNDLSGHGFYNGSGSGHDSASDDASADTLVGGSGDNTMWGQKGNDEFFTDNYAVSANDFMFGGDGNDTFNVRGHDANAYAVGEAGNDRLIPLQSATQHVDFEGGSGWDWVDYRAWTARVYVTPNGLNNSGLKDGARRQLIQTDVESVDGTAFNDHFSGTNGNNAFYGQGGNDLIYGYGGNDTLAAGAGNDTVYASSGNDLIIGDTGNDFLFGDAGNDTVFGGANSDDIHGGSGHDALYGDDGTDWIYGDAGNDKLVGGAASDYLHAADGIFGNDVIFGDNENGTGSSSSLDAAFIDLAAWSWDFVSGVESVAF